jgi:hypothetical protein
MPKGHGRTAPSIAVPAEDDVSERPLRFRVQALVTMNADSDPVEATVYDVSETGLKIITDGEIAIGPITVKMVGFPIFSGRVRWQCARYAGIEFSNPIPTHYLATWLHSHGYSRS